MVPMAHTWWSALCNLSQLGNKSFTSPPEKVLEGFLTLNIQTTAGIWVLQVYLYIITAFLLYAIELRSSIWPV